MAVTAMLVAMPASGIAKAVPKAEGYFAVNKSIDLLGEVYHEVTGNYVDPVNPGELMFAGIDGMLAQLDPYTALLDESQSDDLSEVTTGRYAGIGITIGLFSGELYIVSVMDGQPAANAGLRIGDRIVSVDGVPVRAIPLDKVRSLIKGVAGSKVRIGISRPGVADSRTYAVTRKEVRVSSIGYAALFDGIGYVALEGFGERSFDELRSALSTLRASAEASGGLKGIVLDLRGNPGGLLSSSVDVASLFLREGSLVVSTRGRAEEGRQRFTTRTGPLLPDTPLVLLIDGDSASASEIVAAAIQELDRGVIVGEASFGKGLVQSIIALPYDHVLKLTTSKYYTPSGRLIQKPVPHDGSMARAVLPEASMYDSTKAYYTLSRRKVYGGGGIRPDITVTQAPVSGYEAALEKRGMMFRFASIYRSRHDSPPGAGFRSADLFPEFRRFLDSEHFAFRSKPQELLDSLKLRIGREYGGPDADRLQAKLGELDKAFASLLAQEIDRDSSRIATRLSRELLRHYDEKAARKAAIDADPVVMRAFALVRDPKSYRSVLRP